jgi:Mn2+/Fe2+ NRAMP family transporter
MMMCLFVANFGTTVAEFAGWAASWEIFGVSKYVVVPLGAFFIWVLVTKGSYVTVERVLLFACLLYFGYVISGFLAGPDWTVVAKSTVLPELRADPAYMMLTIAIIGTTITPWMQFYLQSSIAEKGISKKHYKLARLDVITGCFITPCRRVRLFHIRTLSCQRLAAWSHNRPPCNRILHMRGHGLGKRGKQDIQRSTSFHVDIYSNDSR